MNNILKLRGKFKQKKRDSNFGLQLMKKNSIVNLLKIKKVISNLEKCNIYWKDVDLIEKAIISVEYIDLVPKSRRISSLFKGEIVGAKFVNSPEIKHVISYYVEKHKITSSIKKLELVHSIIDKKLSGEINNEKLEKIESVIDFDVINISKTDFIGTVVDISNIEKIYVQEAILESNERKIISLYETEKDPRDLLLNLGIELSIDRIRRNTLLLDPDEIDVLNKTVPYLIAMEVNDLSKIPAEIIYNKNNRGNNIIKKPFNEPIIGVIDTPFNKGVYFSDWVDDYNLVKDIINESDKDHGTGVSSIIVDGSRLNPLMDDGCGNFRVRHFGISPGGKYSSFKIMLEIEKIVATNPEIKVWNFSLGSNKEIENNFISPEGSILDEIQNKYDVIFVVAGTNMPDDVSDYNYKIGSPADSINSIVVNPVDINGQIASYARKGGVLSFYIKPDVCYFGGDINMPMNVSYAPNCEKLTSGTSYAAPWISRKLAYLIHILGFTREEAKAILIDSAEKWNEKYNKEERLRYGHGIVQTNINDIINTNNDEIKFIISGISEKYDTYNYQLPVPMDNGNYPFAVKATMCYFPKCERNQGVDYTNTEFELKIGRLEKKKVDNSYSIKSINNDLQDEDGSVTTEEKARNEFRKWDNTKCIKEKFSTRSRDKKSYENPLWGISVKTKNRLSPTDGENIKFGLVVTLKELHGKNRISEFIQMCSFNQWFVEEINLNNKLELYNDFESDIEFNDE